MCSGILTAPHCPQGPTVPNSLTPCLILFLSHIGKGNDDLYKIQN